MTDLNIREVLSHVILYLRRGQFADANLSWGLYKSRCGEVPAVSDAMQAGDLIKAADLVEQCLLPHTSDTP